MPRKDANTGPISAQAQQDLVSEGIENFELPKSLVTKIAKSAIPESTKLQKETVLSLVKGSTVFINYLAATAHDVALGKQHKSISANDVLKALEIIEFGDLAESLQHELAIYRSQNKVEKVKKAPAKSNEPAPGSYAALSASIAARAKGKERERSGLPPPFTHAPLQSTSGMPSGSYASTPDVMHPGLVNAGAFHADMVMGAAVDGEIGRQELANEGDSVDDAEMGAEEEDGEDEELEDRMAIEEEEILRDARGLQDRETVLGQMQAEH